jgi:hypothetical protein
MNSQRTNESFVARIWLEGEPDDHPNWRGRIQHVQSNREAYFQDLADMSAFVEQVSGVPLPLMPKPKPKPKPKRAPRRR